MPQARTQPEALVASANQRVGMCAEYRVPNVASTGECGVATESPSQVAIDFEAKRQNQVDAKGHRTQELQEAGMTLGHFAVRDDDDQTSNSEANSGGRTASKPQQPEGHSHKRDVHKKDVASAAILAIGPAHRCSPEGEEPADQTQPTEHALGSCGSHVHSGPCPKRTLHADLGRV